MDHDLRFPIGEFEAPETIDDAQVARWVDDIERLPARLRSAVRGLDAGQLATRYRPGGWTVAQVVHHVADSHLNSYARFRLALTEDRPAIRPYDEAAWGELPDARDLDVEASLALVEALHARWVELLKALGPEEWDREFFHPESGEVVPLRRNAGIYSWHGRHHLAHITSLAAREDWGVSSG